MVTTTIDVRLVPATQYVTPLTATTVTVLSTGAINLMINPAGTIAALTITMPSGPSDGDMVRIASTQIITVLTMNGGTIVLPLTTMALGAFAAYVFSSNSSNWLRIG